MDEFTELEDSPQENFTPTGVNTIRKFKGPWESRIDFIRTLVEYPYPGSTLAASSISITPFDKCPREYTDIYTSANIHKYAEITVTYSSNPEEQIGGGGGGGGGRGGRRGPTAENGDQGSFFTYSQDGALEIHTVKGGVRWRDYPNDKVPPDIGGIIRMPVANHQLQWHRVDSPNFARLDDWAGMINSTPFRMPVTGTTYKAGHLLYTGYSLGAETNYDDIFNPTVSFRVTLNFISRERNWNLFYKDSGEQKGYKTLQFQDEDGDWRVFYLSADLNKLIIQK